MNELVVDVQRKMYPKTQTLALADFKLTAKNGEFIAVVGPSGAGKSTLLNILAGLDKTLEGTVTLAGKSLHGETAAHIGFMFQDSRLMPWLTVLDNLLLVLDNHAYSVQRAKDMLAAVGLSGQESTFPARLSGGMQRRVALARAFVIQPALLLMDEPFISVDAPTAQRLRDLLLALWQASSCTVIFVTHDLREALALADRVVFLSHSPGRIILSHAVDIPRPHEPNDPRINQRHDMLLLQYPELLSGVL